MTSISSDSGADFQATIENGEIAIFPTDTLYGIACDPDDAAAAERIHELKGRPPRKPSAVMYFTLERLLADVGDDLDEITLNLVQRPARAPRKSSDCACRSSGRRSNRSAPSRCR
jgi:L-threonylcarbamoyladenylate synthase